MAKQCESIYTQLPEIWKRLDHEGVLENFLGLWDQEFGDVRDWIETLLSVHNEEVIPDKYLKLLGDLVGHRWRDSQDYDWNRRRIREAVRRYSYKGTLTQLQDLVAEHGGIGLDVVDMASRLVVLGKQGRLGCRDAAILAPDYWHDGAFEIRIDRRVDYDAFQDDLQYTKPAAEVWYFVLYYYLTIVWEDVWMTWRHTMHPEGNTENGTIGFGVLGVDLPLYCRPSGDAWREYGTVGWHYELPWEGRIGFGQLGANLWLSVEPQPDTERDYGVVGWHYQGNTLVGTIGHSKLGVPDP